MRHIFNDIEKAEADLLIEVITHLHKTSRQFLKMISENAENDQAFIQSIRNRLAFAEEALAELRLKRKA